MEKNNNSDKKIMVRIHMEDKLMIQSKLVLMVLGLQMLLQKEEVIQ